MFNSHDINQTGGLEYLRKTVNNVGNVLKGKKKIESLDGKMVYDYNELLLLGLIIRFVSNTSLSLDLPLDKIIKENAGIYSLNITGSTRTEPQINKEKLEIILTFTASSEDMDKITLANKFNSAFTMQKISKAVSSDATSALSAEMNENLKKIISFAGENKIDMPIKLSDYLLYDFAKNIGIQVGSTYKIYTESNTDIGNAKFDTKFANIERTKVNNTIASLGLNISAIFATIQIFLAGLVIPALVSTGVGFVAVTTVSIAIGLMFRFQSTKWSEYKDTAKIILGQLLSIQEHVIKMKLFYAYLISSDNSNVKNIIGDYVNIENYNNPLVKLEVCIYKLMYNILTHIDWTTSIMIGTSKNKRRVDLYNTIKESIIEPYFEFNEHSFLYGQFGGAEPEPEPPLSQEQQEQLPQQQQQLPKQRHLQQQKPPTEKLRYSTKTCQHIKGINNDKSLNANLKAQCNNINDKILRLIEYKFLFLKIHTTVENNAKKEDKERLEILKSNIPDYLHDSRINVSKKFNEWLTANSNYTVLVREHVIITSLLAEATFIYNDHIAVLTNNSDTKDFITTFFSKYRRTQGDLNKELNKAQESLNDISSEVGADVGVDGVEAGNAGTAGTDGNVDNVDNGGVGDE